MAKSKGGEQLTFTPQRFRVGFDLYPLVAMIRENALELAQNLSSHHEWTDIHMSDEEWVFSRRQPRQGQPGGAIEVRVKEDDIGIEHHFPTGGLERFEILADQVIEAVERVINPQIILRTSVSLEYVVSIGGDSREALLGALKLIGEDEESDKLQAFARPCHFVGLRLGFPPYRVKPEDESEKEPEAETAEQPTDPRKGKPDAQAEEEEEGEDWQATLTLQALPDEPTSLTVEVDGLWMAPSPWQNVAGVVRSRLGTVDKFLRTKISEFLKHFRSGR